MITDPGDKLWREIFKKSPEETRMPEKAKRFFSDVLLFQSEPGVGRVLFLAAPLQGSDMASNWAGRIGSSLVRSPRELLQAGRHALSGLTFQPGELRIRRIPNSIDTLAPNNRFVKAINKIPMKPDVPVHVICGDRGKGGNKDKTPPVMSDGIVPYWSSHIPTAKSELIVPSNHAVHQNPQAIAEVARILKASVNQSAR
jgi:hypothetical protein